MKLYYSPGACSLAPHILLEELGIPYSLMKVDLQTKAMENGEEFKSINPKNYIPALQLDSGEIFTEAAAMLYFLADLRPELQLIPTAGQWQRYRCYEWMNYISTEVHKGFSPLFGAEKIFPAGEVREEFVAKMKKKLEKNFDFLAQNLEGKKYFLGEDITIVDIYAFVVLSWAKYQQMDLKQWPVLYQWFRSIKDRPATVRAMQGEGLIKSL